MTGRTRRCDDAIERGRMRKAEQFWGAAESVRELADDEAEIGDVYVTLCVHAGIAAADVVCCVALGEHTVGEDHSQAVALIRRTRPDGAALATALSVLLGMKTRAGYGASPVSVTNASERSARPGGSCELRRIGSGARDNSGGSSEPSAALLDGHVVEVALAGVDLARAGDLLL
jgi:hypothetical protein